ncbi:MAG: GAF domain-containing protein [Chloroflexi bacterium]|nr:GAF domain-containing protein [Chloroflexota bacterium]
MHNISVTKESRGAASQHAVGELFYDLSRLPLEQGLARALDIHLQITKAEAAEIFLRDPVTGDMILAAHRGLYPAAFSQITRFRSEEGYPGIVVVRQEPILTTDLRGDARYLRSRVKERGFRSYMCVPLRFKDNVLGCLNLASREYRDDFSSFIPYLSGTTSVMAMAVQIGLYEAEKALDNGMGEVGRGFDDALRHILRSMMGLGEAKRAMARLYDPGNGHLMYLVVEGGGVSCLPEHAMACPALAERGTFLPRGGQRREGIPCRGIFAGSGLTVCFPLVFEGQPLGVLRLDYEKAPRPPTRDVPRLAGMTARASQLLGTNWGYLKDREAPLLIIQGGSEHGGRAQSLPRLNEGVSAEGVENGSVDTGENTPVLDIRCLGTFQVFRNGELIPRQRFLRRKAVTLLQVLATYHGSSVPADTLAEYLWPEENPDLTAHRLQVVVSTLRRVVDRCCPDQRWQFIRNERGSYSLELSSACRVDVAEYGQLLSRAGTLEKGGRIEEALYLRQEAVQLYRGDLLEDDPDGEWSWMRRETLRETQLDMLRWIALTLAQRGDVEVAILYCRRALSLDPLREEIHRQLMILLLQAGRRDEARRQYLRCRAVLERELGVSPIPETEAIYKAL